MGLFAFHRGKNSPSTRTLEELSMGCLGLSIYLVAHFIFIRSMSGLFIILLAGTLGLSISFFCSLMEASLFAVPLAYVRHRADQNSRAGQILLKFKEEMGDPIAAVLIFNTISHTAAAAVVGARAAEVWGQSSLIWVSAIYTLMILFIAEIFPKQVGVLYARQVSFLIAWPLYLLIKVSYPMIVVTKFVDKLLKRNEEQPAVTRQEVVSMAEIGKEEGVLHPFAATAIHNLVGLDKKRVRDVLTPRVVVFRLAAQRELQSVREELLEWNYSRIPLFDEDYEDRILGFILQREISNALIRGEEGKKLVDFVRPISVVPEVMDLQSLFHHFQESREHICSVVDEHGTFVGLVTLEDLLEEILGSEIVDESDLVTDLRTYAKLLFEEKRRRQGRN